jgi:hypothetical protein
MPLDMESKVFSENASLKKELLVLSKEFNAVKSKFEGTQQGVWLTSFLLLP